MEMKTRLKVLRAEKNITQIELSKATGLNLNLIINLERNNFSLIKKETLETLSKFFGNCPIQDIIYFEKVS